MLSLHSIPAANEHRFAKVSIVSLLVMRAAGNVIYEPFTPQADSATFNTVGCSQDDNIAPLPFRYRMVRIDNLLTDSNTIMQNGDNLKATRFRRLDSVRGFVPALDAMKTDDFVLAVVAKLKVWAVASWAPRSSHCLESRIVRTRPYQILRPAGRVVF
jgi:hypothetical protein